MSIFFYHFFHFFNFRWLTGKDGEVWVWVMGEHPNDKTIDEIVEEELKRKAREIAEKEVSIYLIFLHTQFFRLLFLNS